MKKLLKEDIDLHKLLFEVNECNTKEDLSLNLFIFKGARILIILCFVFLIVMLIVFFNI